LSPRAIVWLLVALAFVVLLVLAALQAKRAVADLKRAKARVDALKESPVVAALAGAEANARRLETAAAQVAPLAARSQSALAAIRRGPVPPELPPALALVRIQLAELRRFRLR
jgi:hypothetical protein